MKQISFIDAEIEPNGRRVLDIGSIKWNGDTFHSNSTYGFIQFLKGSEYICGHNIFKHDIKYIQNAINDAGIILSNIIDTLFLSPLLFPAKPYHKLVKDDKLQSEELNNPLNDSIKARDLFNDEIAAFQQLTSPIKAIFYYLLKDKMEFRSFFHYIGYYDNVNDIEKVIRQQFYSQICEKADLKFLISEYPVQLAYCLALINTGSHYSITPPWVLISYPDVERVMYLLRNKPCLEGCVYCNESLNIYKGLKRFFGFSSFRKYAGVPLQEQAVRAAVNNKSLLAVFPTGGGKSITFQLPALMSGISARGLTVVISPLQSLMKDQVDNLEKAGVTEAVTINGLLDPIERAKALERVENGSASILYIAPESLRSRTIEHLILGRNIVRFVIDEAHCFSAWGQDFRVDYLYIGDFIKRLQEKKNMEEGIPVSCFTATAKRKVIEDIQNYFKEKLSIQMDLYTSDASRSNLQYIVVGRDTEDDKYNTVRNLLEGKECPTIIYVSRTRKAFSLALRLTEDGYTAKPYHGKMDKKEKAENQNAFMNGDVRIMVATSAFGMGVDKKDVGMIIHYEISDSLENYVQEAGRAGRDESISADCYVLFNDEDLSKHFILLNQTKLSIKEIQQVWKAIKDITKVRAKVSQSALEIARIAGWDENVTEIETRVTTAIAALEEAGYLRRGQNMPRIFASGILSKNVQEALEKINTSERFNERHREQATRIIRKLFSSKNISRANNDEEAESRVDYISDRLGIRVEEVIRIVNLLREEKILADSKDLTAFIKKKKSVNHSLEIVKSFQKIEDFLATVFNKEEKIYHLKKLNEQAEEFGCKDVTPAKLRTVINLWAIKNWIKRQMTDYSKGHISVLGLFDQENLEEKLSKRHELARFTIEYLFQKTSKSAIKEDPSKEDVPVEFSVMELKDSYEKQITFFSRKVNMDDIEDALFYLSRIGAMELEGGFLVVYNRMTIERLEQDFRKRYTAEDYQKLDQFYQNKIQQIHIVGEYARIMMEDYKAALQFVDDYFQLNYNVFLRKYFRGNRQNEIKKNITPSKFKQLFGELSPTQLKIINDNESKNIVVAAGPGSGKTRILVHKLASLLLMEDVKHEQLLMVTFSRSAVVEFKKRLMKLIGNAANFIEIKTFHSYCFDLLGRVGTLERSVDIIRETVRRIRNGDVEAGRITKTVLVIDEAQDMDQHEYELICALMERNEDMRVIAVGDDDQNIFEFRGASSEYMEKLMREHNAIMYELVENYRSKNNLVDISNQFAKRLTHRLKLTPIIPVQKENGHAEIVRYDGDQLMTPLVHSILNSELSGSTCILTRTNEEAFQITGLLLKNGLHAKLIQSNDGFSLFSLLEVRCFLDQLNLSGEARVIADDIWSNTKKIMNDRFRKSPNLELCKNLIGDFETVNPKIKYKSDLEIYVRESGMEDFQWEQSETVYVSTMHKAKGREFDNVFLMLDQYTLETDEARRLLYVAITRAKNRLSIHYNGYYLDTIKTKNLDRIYDRTPYPVPTHLAMQLSYKDVWLDYFISVQYLIVNLSCGDELDVREDGCYPVGIGEVSGKVQAVLKFSKQMNSQIEMLKQKGYVPKKARVRFILYWQKEGMEEETKIILPELEFEKGKLSNTRQIG